MGHTCFVGFRNQLGQARPKIRGVAPQGIPKDLAHSGKPVEPDSGHRGLGADERVILQNH